jgi:hypothetical protein
MGKAHSQQRGVMQHRRLLKAVNGVMGIVEGVMGQRWVCGDGRRLVDMPQWCELYCAWSELRRNEDEAALAKAKPALMRKIKRIIHAA